MTRQRKSQLLRLVAQRAMIDFDDLTPIKKADLLSGLSMLLPKSEAEEAKHTSFLIREAETHQMKFKGLLK